MTADFTLQRIKMVDGQLRTTDVTESHLLTAMGTLPREEFVPSRRRALAYIDEDIIVADARDGQPARYIMEPSPFAKLVQMARVRPDDFVLDVGCTTGYSSAVLSKLAGSVIALESDPDLEAQATDILSRLGCDNVAVVGGKLAEGCADQGPFDLIILEGAVDFVPDALLDQLKNGGRLVAVVGHGNAGRATLFIKEGGVVSSRASFNAAVRPLPEFQREPGFVF
ncbi:methyltransferase domain-containing protein [Chelativorans sp. ZYF759]|uniref:protein-L-isoaspartate O-methyltransferase family protein n=1 Tax=Chelativorans sp. ZYF759 TaxID=2692213 RepID=UPI00145F58F4|nr:protein-L-isoaspartate O-methyltransferase [Chelativorans sp. ZYF759]NMG38668.1 methyltransferase domain-containing protein [Chelativorans sp. ZYF759]